MLGAMLDCRDKPEKFVARMGIEWKHVGHHRRTPGQRTCLVKRHGLNLGKGLQMPSALDEDSLTGRIGEARHNRYRCRNHQGTGTRYYHQDQRAVDPREERLVEQEGGNDGHDDGERPSTAGVYTPAKRSTDILYRRPLLTRLLHQMDHPGESRVLMMLSSREPAGRRPR